MRKSLFFLVILVFCGPVLAQTGINKLFTKVTTIKDSMVVKGVDRRYIDIPNQPWQIML